MLNWRYKWIKLEEKHQQVMEGLEPFVPKMIRVDDHRVCLVKMEEAVEGVSNICPHAGAALHAGFCNKKGVIGCPLHGYKFDMKTGRSVDGNNYQLKTYKFDLRNDGWYIGIKKF